MSTSSNRFNSSLPGFRPFEIKRLIFTARENPAGQQIIFLPIFN